MVENTIWRLFCKKFSYEIYKKYWRVEVKELEIKWIGNRMYKPTLEEVRQGMETQKPPVTYYAKEMRYQRVGEYKSYLNYLVKDLDIRLENEILKIDSLNKIIYFKNGNKER